MFLIYVDIMHLAQLTRLKGEMTERLLSGLRDIVRRKNGYDLKGKGDKVLFEFPCPYAENLPDVLEGFFQIQEWISSFEGDLFGYHVILDKHAEKEEIPWRKLRSLYLQIPRENALWATPEVYAEIEDYVEARESGSLFEILGRRENVKELFYWLSEFRRRSLVEDAILRGIRSFLEKARQGGMIYICGSGDVGKGYNVRGALNRIAEKEDVPWLWVDPRHRFEEPFYPLLRAADRGVIDERTRYLSEEEQDQWNTLSILWERDHQPGSRRVCPEEGFHDFFSLMDLYVKVYTGYMRDRKMPAVIVVDQVMRLDRTIRTYLEELFRHRSSDRNLVPILMGEENQVPRGFAQLPHIKISLPPMNLDEIQQNFNEIFPKESLPLKELEGLRKKTRGKPLALFHSICAYPGLPDLFKIDTDNPIHYSWQALRRMDRENWRLLYGIILLEGLLSTDQLRILYGRVFKEKISFADNMERLERYGFITLKKEIPLALLPPMGQPMEEYMGSEAEALQNTLADYLFRLWEGNHEISERPLFHFLETRGPVYHALPLLAQHIQNLLDRREWIQVRPYLTRENLFEQRTLSPGEKKSLRAILFAGSLRLAMLQGLRQEALHIIELEEPLVAEESRTPFAGDSLLQKARYYNAVGNYRMGQRYAKEVLVLHQERGDHYGESLANQELGLGLLGEGRIRSAMDYFEISRRVAYQIDTPVSLVSAYIHEALAYRLYGNISRAWNLLISAEKTADEAGQRLQLFRVLFYRGRMAFEQGRWEEAEELFLRCSSLARHYQWNEARHLSQRWIARCRIYGQELQEGRDLLDEIHQGGLSGEEVGVEAAFFAAEALEKEGHFEEATDLLRRALSRPGRSLFLPGEYRDWSSGFADFEDRAGVRSSEEEIIHRQARAFLGYILCRQGNRTEGIALLDGLLENLGHHPDPYTYIYAFYKVLSLPDEPNHEEERKQLLARSLSLLQSRAGRIETQEIKYAYLFKNYWNAWLLAEAKRYHLY